MYAMYLLFLLLFMYEELHCFVYVYFQSRIGEQYVD